MQLSWNLVFIQAQKNSWNDLFVFIYYISLTVQSQHHNATYVWEISYISQDWIQTYMYDFPHLVVHPNSCLRGTVTSWLVHFSPDQVASSPGREHCVSVLKGKTLSQCPSPPKRKWVLANLKLGVNPPMWQGVCYEKWWPDLHDSLESPGTFLHI